jgi:hypothetical protein
MTSTKAYPMTEKQFTYAIDLASFVLASDPAARAALLLEIAGQDFYSIKPIIDTLVSMKKAKIAATPKAAPVAVDGSGYVPPNGYYLVDGVQYHVKASKYQTKTYVYDASDCYFGTWGFGKTAPLVAALANAELAKAAVVAYAKATGVCGACHTTLTDPKSIAKGIGPVCEKKYA